MSGLADEVRSLADLGGTTGTYARTRPQHPQGWEPGVSYERGQQVITSGPVPVDGSVVWDEELLRWGFDPAEVRGRRARPRLGVGGAGQGRRDGDAAGVQGAGAAA